MVHVISMPAVNLCIICDEDKISQTRVTGKLDKADEMELYRQHVFKTDGGVKEEHT